MKKLIVIAGPTASGKTNVAIQLAQYYQCPIVSADSRQLYKEFNIAVARPSKQELNDATHYFIASHSFHNPLSAGEYENETISLLDLLFKTHDVVILCGGTGLFIKAVIQGLNPAAPPNQLLRIELKKGFDEFGISFLQNKLKNLDPEYYEKAEIQNPQRLIRAIEIAMFSNKSVTSFKQPIHKKRIFNSFLYCLDLPRELLYQRINERVDKMIEDGMEEEAKSLFPFKGNLALKTVGYNEFFLFFENNIDKKTCIELIKQNTRRYGKRQITWFKHQGDFEFISPLNIVKHIKRTIPKEP